MLRAIFSRLVVDRKMLLAVVLASAFVFPPAQAQSAPDDEKTAAPDKAKAAPPVGKSTAIVVPQRYETKGLPPKARQYYAFVWGVDSLAVKSVESGEIIRFTYRVLDPEKAKALNDKKNEPSLIDPRSGVKLVVPSLEKVGKLRQSGTPQADKVYWMAFSNKGRYVKPGHRVNVVIGQFRAEGLVV